MIDSIELTWPVDKKQPVFEKHEGERFSAMLSCVVANIFVSSLIKANTASLNSPGSAETLVTYKQRCTSSMLRNVG